MPSRTFLSDVIETVIRNHSDHGCAFAPGAKERVVTSLMMAPASDSGALINQMTELLRAEEIYCPHEGIDRRHEFLLHEEGAGGR